MKLDVLADLDHLFMINFSVPAPELERLVPPPLRLLTKHGCAFPSIVLPCIEDLRPAVLGVPRVSYELFGFRILVEYDSALLGRTKGIYFRRLIMDPNWVRVAANLLTAFLFERGNVTKAEADDGFVAIESRFASGEVAVSAEARPGDRFPDRLPGDSCFATPDEALSTYNDIAYGFLPSPGAVHILQIAEPHPNYIAWPLRHLEVRPDTVRVPPELVGASVRHEPSYFVGRMPRYWRWLPSERS